MTRAFNHLQTVIPCLLLFALPVGATELSISESAGEVVWVPNSDYGTAHLVVAGPNGFRIEHSFFEGELPSISLSDETHEAAEGSYTWNLSITERIEHELKAEVDAARRSGDPAQMRSLSARWNVRSQSFSGHFLKTNGQLIIPEIHTEKEEFVGSDIDPSATDELPTKDQVVNDDSIVIGSTCIGDDCATGEDFGSETVRLKENNLRLRFYDTSTSQGSYPWTDWLLIANDSGSGGANKFVIHDVGNNKSMFTLEADAPTNSLYVEADDGYVGLGTNTPALNLHIKGGDTPTLRLDQDGTAGYPSYEWDIGGNEANFFIRGDGLYLPFRIEDGALENSIYIGGDHEIGLGTQNPTAQLHVSNNDGDTQILVDENSSTAAQRVLLKLENNGIPSFQLEDTSTLEKWAFSVKSNSFEISMGGSGVQELLLDGDGNLVITGSLTTEGGTYADYVFRDDYDLASLDEVDAYIRANGHLPNVKSEEEVEFGRRVNISELSVKLLEKVEELTLYTIEQHKTIRDLNERLNALEAAEQR